jgi:ElaB/YqjD/DUF883 family membrane-anchored ribosome-binding protein
LAPAGLPNLAWWERARAKTGRTHVHRQTHQLKETEMQSASTSGNGQNSPIARDIQNVVTDAQELLKTVQSEGQTKLTEVKGQVQAKLDNAKVRLGELGTQVQDNAKQAMDTTDTYVRDNPWRAVGISAAVGALVGFLIARR